MLFSTKKSILMAVDFCVCIVSCALVYLFLNLSGMENITDYSLALSFVFLPICMIMGMIITRSYDVILRYASANDYVRLVVSFIVGSVAYLLGDMAIGFFDVLLFKFLCCMLAGITMIALRTIYYVYTTDASRKKSMHDKNKKKKTLIIGAGQACRTIIEEMKESKYYPMAIVDDDKQKHTRDICSVKVMGGMDDITRLCDELYIDTILFAIPSCENQRRAEILHICSETGCEVKILPFVREIVGKGNLLFQAKKVSVDDLLGREPIVFSNEDALRLVENNTMLVTGGGGSIGSELCRQIASNNPKKLIILDIYENNAYSIQQELKIEYGDKLDFCVEIASVRDYKKMELIFDRYRPNVVFHAAAHKHVPLMEDNPEEAVKNNIFGTYNCARLADKYKVDAFVLISTDKAVNPTNVMGATKRMCEMIIQYMSQKTKHTKFCAVRFGNVLGSNGSVIPLFNKQIENGGPVTVTHPDIIRYFMTIPEAVSLVLKAASMAKSNEIFVLDMGKPVKIIDLATKLIKLNGYVPDVNMKIEFTGLRPGEKLYEELLMSDEGLKKTSHNKIFVGQQIDVNSSAFYRQLNLLNEAAKENNLPVVLKLISEIVDTYHPSEEFQSMIDGEVKDNKNTASNKKKNEVKEKKEIKDTKKVFNLDEDSKQVAI